MIRFYVFILLFFFSLSSNAFEINVDRDFLPLKENIENNINLLKFKNIDLNSLKITIKKSNKHLSFSNLNSSLCIINIEISDNFNENFLKLNLEQEVMLSVLHELGHCELGKGLFSNGITWENDLSKYNILNPRLIKENEQKILEMKQRIKCSNCLLYLPKETPLITYHEIFADFYSIIMFSKIFSNSYVALDRLVSERKKQYNKNNETNYKSFVGLELLKNEDLSNFNTLKEINYLSQLTFIKILELKI